MLLHQITHLPSGSWLHNLQPVQSFACLPDGHHVHACVLYIYTTYQYSASTQHSVCELFVWVLCSQTFSDQAFHCFLLLGSYAEHETLVVPMVKTADPDSYAIELQAVNHTQHAEHDSSATAEVDAPQPDEKTLGVEAAAGKQYRVTADVADTLQELTASLENSAAQVNLRC